MPRIGNVEVSDDVLQSLGRATAAGPASTARPGLGSIVASSARSAYGQVRYGIPLAVEKLAGTLDANDNAFYTKGLADARVEAAKVQPASFSDVTSGRVGLGRWVAENFAASVPQTVGTLAGSAAGALAGTAVAPGIGTVLGGIAGGTAAGTPFFVGSNVDRAVEENGGLSSAGAARAITTALPQAASDTLVARFLPGAGKLLGGFAAHQTGNFLARTAKSIVKAGATEAVTEAGQQLGERYAAGIDVSGPDAAAEYANAAVTAFAVGGVLGAGGGVRRTAAHIKPAEAVTNEDLDNAINLALSGPAPQLALPAPGQGVAVPAANDLRRPDFQVDPRGNAAPATPAGTAALAANPIADVVVSPAGDALNAPTAADLSDFNNRPITAFDRWRDAMAGIAARGPAAPEAGLDLNAPAVRDILAQRERLAAQPTTTFDPAAPINPGTSSTSALAQRIAQQGVDATPAPVDAPPAARLFTTEPAADLDAAIKAKDASPEVKQAAQTELETRWAEAAGTEPLTTENFADRLADVKHGLTGSFVKKLDATSPADLVDKVYTRVFEDQDTASNVVKLAQRVGLLDERLEPTERANAIEAGKTAANREEIGAPGVQEAGTPVGTVPATPAPSITQVPRAAPEPVATTTPPAAPERVAAPVAAPANPEFAAEWQSLKTAAGIQRESAATKATLTRLGTPANLDDARARVFQALSEDSTSDDDRGSNAATTQVEKLARKLGLVTDDENMDITPLGHRTYLRTPEGQAEIAGAARSEGFAGEAATIFDGGVRAELDGTAAQTFTNFEDMAAHKAGREWARTYLRQEGSIRSNASTSEFMGRVGGSDLEPGQVQQRALNGLLENVDLRNVADTDIAAIRRMIRDGASPAEVGKAIAAVQGGKVLFQEGERVQHTLPPSPTRGQPIFKEINTAEASGTGQSKADQRVENEAAVEAYRLRSLVEFAQREGGITEVRARKLQELLDQGKTDQVARLMRDFDPDAKPAARRERLPTPPGTVDQPGRPGTITPNADTAFEQAIDGKSFDEVVSHMVSAAPSLYHREIMRRVGGLAKQLQKKGMALEVRVVKPGDIVPAKLNNPGLRALARIESNPNRGIVYLKSSEMGPNAGMNYQLAAHEMLHIVTMELIQRGKQRGIYGETKLGKAVKDLNDLRNAVIEHFNARADAGKLNDFERAYHERTNNTLQDVDEVLAWGLTNPEMQRYLQSIEYAPRQSVFSKLVSLIRDLLGLDGKYDTALTELLRVSEQIMGTRGRELDATFARNDADHGVEQALEANATDAGVSAANRTVTASNEAVQNLVGLADRVVQTINPEDLKTKARRTALGWISRNQMDRQFGDRMPGLRALSDALRQKDAVRGRFATLGDQVYQNYEQLERANPGNAKKLMQLMATATQFKLDPDKAFADHTHLEGDANIGALKRLHGEVVKMKNDLSRGDGAGYKLFNEIRAANETQNYARLASELHSLVALDPEFSLGVAGAAVNPMDTFLTQADLSKPADIREFWRKALEQQMTAATAFVARKRGEAAQGSASDVRAAQQHLSPIEARIGATHEALAGMARAPYFHLGRFGDNFGSAVIRKLENGTVDPAAQRHVAEALEKAGFRNAELSADNTRPRFSLRFQTVDQTIAFQKLALQLQKEGWLSDDTIKAGPRTRADNFGVADNMPGFVSRYIEAIKNSPAYVPEPGMTAADVLDLEKRKAEAVQLATDEWIASQPDSSIAKVLTARYTVPGFDPDMMRNFAHRYNVGSTSLASVATSAKIGKAYQEMRAQATEATEASNDQDPQLLADLLTESKKRDAVNPADNTNNTFLDKLRAYGHAYFLGFSPAYGAIQLMQVGTNGIPELAKTHGFGKSFHAVRRATPKAIAVLRAANAAARSQGWRSAADVTLTESVLQAAGLSKNETDFLRQMIATGSIDIGASAHALGQIARGNTGSKVDVALKYASAIGMYTETASRLMTALAAHDLDGSTGASSARYAQDVVSNSMFDYQNWNRARQLGKQGFAGPVTPLLTQFMTYSAQMTEKLFSEFHGAVGAQRPNESAESAAARRAASRTFLLGHMTAITALTGTLGLPFASVFATVIDRLVGALDGDDEPFDATASWRGLLADMLGKDVAEVVSRGLPRAVGFDISARTGEADLLPFSQLLADRRSWKESVSAFLGRASGASPDMLMNIADGGSLIANGDVLGGMKSMLPVAFKGPTEAYRMTTEGYVDTKGNKLPMTPGAASILWQLIGFNPAEKAEYSEARGDQQSRRLGVTQQGNKLRQQIVRALLSGDQDGASQLIERAQEFDKSNPAFAVIPSLAGALQRQQAAAERARALQAPLGVTIDDLAGQQLTDYANVNYR